MATEENKLAVAIGVLQSEVEELTKQFEELKESTIEEHRKVHDIVVATSESVRNLTREVAEIRPLAEDYREKRAEARGAARLAGWLYTAAGVVGGLVVWFGGLIADWIKARPHP